MDDKKIDGDEGEVKTSSSEDMQADAENEKEQEISKLKDEVKAANDSYLRALAEVENIRKRTAREREEYVKFAALPLVKKMLTVIDDLDRAVSMYDPEQNPEVLVKGVEMINTRLKEIVEQEGAEALHAVGKPFDPQYHQPLAIEQNSNYPENTVIEELQKGYMMHGRVIRPSLVKVSN
ncbi:heat shock protein grpe [hydrocarbon metagenome]|uniref:Heat shock protein grpe n=1 Tax=hydrocarbon metagenome TaxID=938273 RepID=A0A0W8E6M5_9ZZZZ